VILARDQLADGPYPGASLTRVFDFGDPAGAPALYFHGTPSSAREARWLHRASCAHGVRLLAFDRSNTGGSLLEGARQGLVVVDNAGVDRFATVGFSGGAGYALAAAHLSPERVTVAHLGGSLAAGGASGARRLVFAGAAHIPWLVRPVLAGAIRLNLRGLDGRLADPRAAARWFFDGPARGAQIAAVEAYIDSTDPDDLAAELCAVADAARATDAVVGDASAYGYPWPFDLGAVRVPVEVWHGEEDPAAPIGQARQLAAALPNATLHAFPGEGHFVIHSHADEIAASIEDRAR
jgi:pimeloyl-ACP methyl ester carboxylesterase